MSRGLAALMLAASAALVLSACDPQGGSSIGSTPAPATSSTTSAAAPTSDMPEQQAHLQIEAALAKLGFKVVPDSEAFFMGGMGVSIKLDLGCTAADGVDLTVDGTMVPTGVTADVPRITTNSDGSIQSTHRTASRRSRRRPRSRRISSASSSLHASGTQTGIIYAYGSAPRRDY